ncbi:MAG: polysaccharide pyruvyl transferase family protein [Helicobacteraceae bacterium]|jgi:polysaccharide pyruvyl transferase WcaK-like protein|nr:polysaccharide pyruvyl transferase family protein [Helicobacteraceae bacterium]
MKIALIKCSGNLNVGNEFINAGGEFLVRQVFPNANFYTFEFFDSCIEHNYKYPSEPLLPNDADFINKECDMVFVFSGSIISKYTKSCLLSLAKLQCKKILLGAGAYQYDDFDKQLCQELATKYDYIFTRDSATYGFFNGAENVFSGIDCAFFVKDSFNNTGFSGDYAVINLDLIEHHIKDIKKAQNDLKSKYKDVYVVENTATKYSDVPGFLYHGYWDTLFKIFSNAKFVITNRIHTAVVCTCYGVPFEYRGYDSDGNGRSALFGEIEMTLSKRTYSYEQLEKTHIIIEARKSDMIELLENALTLK